MHRVLRAGLRIGGVVLLLTMAGAARAEYEEAVLGFVLGAVVGSALADDDDDDDRRYRYVDYGDYRHGYGDDDYHDGYRHQYRRQYGHQHRHQHRYRHGYRHDRRCRDRDRDDD